MERILLIAMLLVVAVVGVLAGARFSPPPPPAPTPGFVNAAPQETTAAIEITCPDNKSYVLDTGTSDGGCGRRTLPDGTTTGGVCRDGSGNEAEASCGKGCEHSQGKGSCTNGTN